MHIVKWFRNNCRTKKLSTGIILIRIKGQRQQDKIMAMKKLLHGYREKLLHHFVVITKKKIRIIAMGDIK